MAGNSRRRGTGDGLSNIQAPDFLPDDLLLKPKLDSIFAEVENSLPSIDFEISDVSSEEESPIFHRALKTPTFDDEHSDNSLEGSLDSAEFRESMKAIPKSRGTTRNQNTPKVSSFGTSAVEQTSFGDGSDDNKYDFELSKSTPSEQQESVESTAMSTALTRMEIELGVHFDFTTEGDSQTDIGQSESSLETDQNETRVKLNVARRSQRSGRPHSPRQINWTNDVPIDENTIELEISSPPVSPRSEKRREIPELSPQRESGGEEIIEESKISGALKHKGNSERLLKTKAGKSLSKEKYNSSNSEQLVSTYFTDAPQLNLESVNLDKILIGIVTGSKLPEDVGDISGGDKNEPSLIQKLAQASLVNTEANDVDPTTGAIRKKKSTFKEAKTAQNVAVAKQSMAPQKVSCMGTNTSDLANLPMGELSPRRPVAPPENKTIYLDLRHFEEHRQEEKINIEKVQRILRINEQPTESSSDSSDDEGGLMWHERRKQIKESLSRTGALPRSFYTSKQKKSDGEAAKKAPSIRQTQAQRLEVHLNQKKNKTTASDNKEQASETATAVERKTTDAEKVAADKAEILRKIEETKKRREQKEAERQSRIRLGQRLEALRPQASSKAKQDPAESTNTLFDVESSYEPAPLTLSAEMSSHPDVVLLTVHLASTGEVVIHRSSTSKSVDSGLGLSATYTSLLTWFLSLVPDTFSFLQSEPSAPVFSQAPFVVLGLQQMYLDGQLVLYVAIKPIQNFDEKTLPETVKKTKKREEMKDLNPFQMLLTTYLSRNTLHSVCPWLGDLVSMAVTSSRGDGRFSYKPPLPNITNRPLSTFIQITPDPQAVQKVFGLEVGFFWETVDSDENVHEQYLHSSEFDYDTQNTMSLIYKKVFRNPRAVMGILNRVLQEGLDLAGIRLLYPTPELMDIASGKAPRKQEQKTPLEMLNTIGPVLALALRGTFARTLWLDAVGPSDPALARKTDPNSLCALYGGETREESLIFCPRNPSRVNTELCRWFGGRVPASGVINTGTAQNQSSRGKKRGLGMHADLPAFKPPSCLTAISRGEVFIVISPLVPTKCMGLVLATCQRRGYQMRGVRRTRLNSKKATLLGIPVNKVPVFSVSGSTPASPTATKSLSFDLDKVTSMSRSPRPCSVLLLNKENALHSTASLIEAFMVQMSLLNVLGEIQRSTQEEVTSSDLFHVAQFTDQVLNQLGGQFSKTPDADFNTEHGYIAPQLYSNPELEEIVVLTLTGHSFMKNFGLFLGKLQNMVPYSRTGPLQTIPDGFELLGIKWLPSLSAQHAKQLTPYEVGDKQWKPSIQMLTSEPAVVLVLRGVNAFHRMEAVISHKPASHTHQGSTPLDRIMSPTPELAYLQATLFFRDHELFADNDVRGLLLYLPPPVNTREETDLQVHSSGVQKRPTRQTKAKDVLPAFVDESIFKTMQIGERPITTILLIKPDVAKKHLPKLLKRITHEGFRVVALRQLMLDEEAVKQIIPSQDQKNEMLYGLHCQYLTNNVSMVMCLQRECAVKKLLDLLGPADPRSAKKQSSFLWRAMFGSDPIANGLYCSLNYKSAVLDQKFFFPAGLCCQSTIDSAAEQVTCPCVDEVVDGKLATTREVQFYLSATQATQMLSMKSSGMSTDETMAVTSLTQTNCLLLTPLLLKTERAKSYPYVHIIDYLHQQGFELVGARMMWMCKQQAEEYLHLVDAGTFNLVSYLTSGPCLVLAAQRDNAVLAFEALLGSSFDKDSVYSKYNSKIMRPKNIQQANKHLAYFFTELAPSAQLQIVHKASTPTT